MQHFRHRLLICWTQCCRGRVAIWRANLQFARTTGNFKFDTMDCQHQKDVRVSGKDCANEVSIHTEEAAGQFGVFQVRTIKTFHETNSLYSCLTSDSPGLMLALSAKMPSRLLRATQSLMRTMRRADNWFARLPQMPVETCQMSVINRGMSAGKACDWWRYSFKVPWPRCNGNISRQVKPARQWRTVFKAQAQKMRISTQLRGSQGTQPPTSPCIETSHGGTRLIPQMEKIFQSAGHFPRIFATLRSNESEKRT